MTNKTVKQWLHSIEQCHPMSMDFTLGRIRQLAKKLDLLQWHCPVITVAGTNGKGSTVASLESIYTQANYSIGTFTSPHIEYFNERIRLSGKMISDTELVQYFELVEATRESTPLTFFEINLLVALLHFKRHKPDIIVLEVGLGGRLDATNIIDCDLAIITTVDYDHQDILGSDLDSIGYEKAGIIRPNAPVIIADTVIPQTVIKHALSIGAAVYKNGIDYAINGHVLTIGDEQFNMINAPVHINSVAAAIYATQLLKHTLPVAKPTVLFALGNIALKARQEWNLINGVTCLLDVAHNVQSVQSLKHTIMSRRREFKHIRAIFSTLADKDTSAFIKIMNPVIDAWYPCQLNHNRAVDASKLIDAFESHGIEVSRCDKSCTAIEAAFADAQPGDLIVVFGSFYLLSELYKMIKAMGEIDEVI